MKRLLVFAVAVVGLAMPATAQAWTSNHFYTQSRDIECKLYPSRTPPYDVMGCYRFGDRMYVYIARGTQYPAVQVSVGYPASTWSMAPQWGSGYTLFPGQHWTMGTEFRCSAVSGYTGRMDCWSLRTGHGFLMSKFGLRKY